MATANHHLLWSVNSLHCFSLSPFPTLHPIESVLSLCVHLKRRKPPKFSLFPPVSFLFPASRLDVPSFAEPPQKNALSSFFNNLFSRNHQIDVVPPKKRKKRGIISQPHLQEQHQSQTMSPNLHGSPSPSPSLLLLIFWRGMGWFDDCTRSWCSA